MRCPGFTCDERRQRENRLVVRVLGGDFVELADDGSFILDGGFDLSFELGVCIENDEIMSFRIFERKRSSGWNFSVDMLLQNMQRPGRGFLFTA